MIFSLLMTSTAVATTFLVGTGADFSTIGMAIDESEDGDTIEVMPGTYAERVAFHGKAISVIAVDGPSATLITGDGTATVWLDQGEGPDSILSGFTIQGLGHNCMYIAGSSPRLENLVIEDCGSDSGVYGGGAQVIAASPTFASVTFQNNTAERGGAIYVADASDISIENSAFVGNQAESGGAILVSNSVLTASESRFDSNQAHFGNAGALFMDSSIVDIQNSHFDSNQATFDGGAILAEGGSLTLTGMSTFSNNVSSFGEGGSIRLEATDPVIVTDTDFSFNTAGSHGGAVSMTAVGEASFANTTMTDNMTGFEGDGGALFVEYSGAQLSSSSFESNHSSRNGGAIATIGSDLSGSNVDLRHNHADNQGGGIGAEGGTIVLEHTEFHTNTAASGGGGLSSSAIETMVSDTHFQANESTGGDGGALDLRGVEATIFRILAIENWAQNGGAISASNGVTLSLKSSVLQENECLLSGGATSIQDDALALIRNNDFLGNKTLSTDNAAQLALFAPGADVRNNIIVWGIQGAGLYVSSTGREDMVFRHNDVYGNEKDYDGTDASPDPSLGNISLDPKLEEISLDRDFENDDLYLKWDSPCVGSGDLDSAGPAGLPDDIGAYGLSDRPLVDADDDGFSPETGEDCDDADPMIHLFTDEVCEDGLDNNCDGRIDEDCAPTDTGSDEEDIPTEDSGILVDTGTVEPTDTTTNDDERPGSDPVITDTILEDIYPISGKGCSCTSNARRQVGLWWCLIPLLALRRWSS
jgi:predicted outer membrane repeat protein